jgi:hypothetical protein
MRFRQPNSLARALHQVVSDLTQGQTVELRFESEAEVRHLLEVLHEVASERRVLVNVHSTGRRSLELSLGH